MPLVIILSHSDPITPDEFKSAGLNLPKTDQKSALSLPPGGWLVKTNESLAQIKEKLAKVCPNKDFSIFKSPHTNWVTTIKDEKLVGWIRDGVNSGIVIESIDHS